MYSVRHGAQQRSVWSDTELRFTLFSPIYLGVRWVWDKRGFFFGRACTFGIFLLPFPTTRQVVWVANFLSRFSFMLLLWVLPLLGFLPTSRGGSVTFGFVCPYTSSTPAGAGAGTGAGVACSRFAAGVIAAFAAQGTIQVGVPGE